MNINKTKVQTKSRKLGNGYTVEDPQSLKLLGTLSDEVYDDYAKIIQAFSRESLDMNKSEKLQSFLFGDERF